MKPKAQEAKGLGMPFLKTRNLHASILAKCLDECKRWVEAGADINNRCSHDAALNLAIKARCQVICQYLLGLPELNPNAVDADGETALTLAAAFGNTEVAEFLLRLGASVNAPNGEGHLPLHCAAMGNQPKMASLLIEHGADVNQLDKAGWSPLLSAAAQVNVEVAEVFLSHGSDLERKGPNTETAMGLLASKMLISHSADQRRLQMMSALIDHGCELDCVNGQTGTYLHQATKFPQPGAACLLLSSGCRVDTPDSHGFTALHQVVHTNNKEMAQYLLLYGSDPNIPSSLLAVPGQNPMGLPLLSAFYSQDSAYPVEELLPPLTLATDLSGDKGEEILNIIENYPVEKEGRKELLLQCISQVREKELLHSCVRTVRGLLQQGGTPQMNLLEKISALPLPSFVKKQLALGMDYWKKNPWNACRLHMAVQEGNVKEIFRVLDTGVDPNVNLSCCTPMMTAIWKHQQDQAPSQASQRRVVAILQCLLDGGGSVNAASVNGYMPLHTAAATGQTKTVSWLLCHGCDVMAKTYDGHSALDLAQRHGYLDTAALLQSWSPSEVEQ